MENDLAKIPSEQEIAKSIIEETDQQKLNDLTNIFNLYQTKKNLIRAGKLNDLLDSLTDNMAKRIKTYPDNFTNKEIVDYFETIQKSITKADEISKQIKDAPQIQVNQVNINTDASVSSLPKESRDRIVAAISAILNSSENDTQEVEIIQEEN